MNQNKTKTKLKPSLKILCLALMITLPPFSGCLSADDSDSNDSLDDGEIVIVTYDVYALTDEMISTFENDSGLAVRMLKLDDAGSVLDYLIQNKGNSNVDLAIGLDLSLIHI